MQCCDNNNLNILECLLRILKIKIKNKEVVNLMKREQQDFRTEKYIRYGIRKYSFGAASVAIAAGLMFLGNGAVSANENKQVDDTAVTVKQLTDLTDKVEDKKDQAPVQKEAEVKNSAEEKTVEAPKATAEKAAEVKVANKAALEANVATLEMKLASAKNADASVVNSAKEVLAAAKATLSNPEASQLDVNTLADKLSALGQTLAESDAMGQQKKLEAEKVAAK